jgi:hypothetical protein
VGRNPVVGPRVYELLRAGRSPADAAGELNLPISTVFEHCDRFVVAGTIRRADLLYSIPKERREAVAVVFNQKPLDSSVDRRLLDLDCKTVVRYGLGNPLLGDLYEYLRRIEVTLHEKVLALLAEVYGEANWWACTVPERTRFVAEERKRRDRQPSLRLEQYLSMQDLAQIVDSEWPRLQAAFPDGAAKQRVIAYLARLVTIRNWVMHPTRGVTPRHEDVIFTRDAGLSLGLLHDP